MRKTIVVAEQLESRVFFTTVGLSDGKWLINGTPTDAGSALQGLLPNSRMVQATFDDLNIDTVGSWKYPDTGKWDADRNTNEFVAAVPGWRANGLLAVTLNMQGGGPKAGAFANNQPWKNTAYRSDGTLRSAYLDRMERAIRALNQNGMVAILGLFYFGQDQRLADESAVKQAVNNVTDWITAKGFRNVVVEINNEADLNYDHAILRPDRVAELIDRVKSRSGGKLLVSTSLSGGVLPPDAVIAASDFVLLHGNGQSASGITAMVAAVRLKTAKAVVFNEDSTILDNFHAAVRAGASWGYYDQGSNNYTDGFQSPAVNWRINTAAKQSFFSDLAVLSTSVSPVVGFKLIDADHDVVLGDLTNGQTIDLAGLPSRNLNIVAALGAGTFGSVRFDLDGVSRYHIENVAPYALFGDTNGDYAGRQFAAGTHTLTARAYSGEDATGVSGARLTASFTIINGYWD